MSRQTFETTKIIKETKIKCDYCEHIGISVCELCKKDICNAHKTYDDRDPGDYPDVYCMRCWEIGTPFRLAMEREQQDSEKRLERMEEDWKKAALNQK